ncbi:serine-type D-Ala-D-Ala carboxypeptidase domain protein [Streptococcus porcinus]|uniref:serine hydrolase n=1 Tax=Streptococcus porcinus TaxID=1340 RepID=UPI0010CAAF84|nr:serine hydrolase [Streptococcus porcinus]VTS14963.1 serine-type D-Ala-D-Ala carboxypeptidase domain protein [Streptococcus porcinus]
MKKLLALMIMVFFVSPVPVISTEKEINFSNTHLHPLTQSIASRATYFSNIPQNPNLYYETNTYSDANLNIFAKVLKPNDDFQITDLLLNGSGTPVFALSDGTYIEANRRYIYDDMAINQVEVNLTFWLQGNFTVYKQPFVKGISTIKTDLTAFTNVHASQMAQTQEGNYYYIDNKGWISEKDLSRADNRMVKVQEVLSQKYNKDKYSIYVKQLDSQASAGINADKMMYSASIAKLATLYYVQNQLNTGQIKLDKPLKYVNQVNHFDGAYGPSGSGHIDKEADNKEYTVDTLLKAIAQHSDNVATNILGYYVANKYDHKFYSQINAISGIDWNMESRMISSHAAANIMESIYYQKGEIISYLSQTDFDNKRISKNIQVPVAHKIGDAYDYKHDVAIVYGNSPFILSIFTDKSSYDDITDIADDVYAILK